MLLGLAVAAGGAVLTASAQAKANDAQAGVLRRATKLNAATSEKNRSLLMGEAKQQAPAAQTAGDAAAAGQAQQAMTKRTDDALALYKGSRTGLGVRNADAVAGQVQSSVQPRTNALSVIQGNAEGNRRRLQLADRTNEDIDANTSATGRLLGLLPLQMNSAANAGRGMALGGQLASAAGNGLMQQSIWSAGAGQAGAAFAPRAGAGDLRRQQVPAGTYVDPYADPSAYRLAQV